jgi:glutathione S-transferase
MLKLWGRANSSNVMKVTWLLGELGLAHERIDAGLAFGRTATPEYRAMNPLGVVPSLEDGDFTLFESNVICRYLCTAYAPNTSLFSQDTKGRAQIESWMDFQQTTISPMQSTVFQGLVRIAPEKRNWDAIHAAIVQGNKLWGILDARLASQDYVVANEFTIADITFGVHVHRWLKLDIPGRVDLPNLTAWYERLVARPAYQTHVVAIALT